MSTGTSWGWEDKGISSWLNVGHPAPPGRASAAGQKFLAPAYYSQRAVFASLWALFSLCDVLCWLPVFCCCYLFKTRTDVCWCRCWRSVLVAAGGHSSLIIINIYSTYTLFVLLSLHLVAHVLHYITPSLLSSFPSSLPPFSSISPSVYIYI